MDAEIVNLLKLGKKLEAIKKCQEIGGLSFQEAKTYVEEIEAKTPIEQERSLNESQEDSLEKEVKILLDSGKKLAAIKKVQDTRGLTFNEAKLYVEGLIEIPNGQPIKSKVASNSIRCEVCNKMFDKSEIRTVETNRGIIKVCSFECENIAKNKIDSRTSAKAKMPLWQKVAAVLIVVILMKACSYATHGGENYGLTHQFLCKIGDTLIPWPNSNPASSVELADSQKNTGDNSSNQTEIITVKGLVIDGADLTPIPGVNIFIEGEDESGTVSDANGEFELSILLSSSANIVFQFVGYETLKSKASDAAGAQREGQLKRIPFVLKKQEGIEESVYDEAEDNN